MSDKLARPFTSRRIQWLKDNLSVGIEHGPIHLKPDEIADLQQALDDNRRLYQANELINAAERLVGEGDVEPFLTLLREYRIHTP